MNQAQQRFLLDRLDEARRAKPSRYDKPKINEPKEVVAARLAIEKARRVVENWDKSVANSRDARNASIDKAFNETKTHILFSTSEVAVKAIEKFEQAKF